MQATRLRTDPIKSITTNSVRRLYLAHRSAYFEALMGGVILVPEGMYDHEWLNLWQRVAQSSPDTVATYHLRPISFVPTSDAAIVETLQEVAKFRSDAVPIIDGDSAGDEYLSQLHAATPAPKTIIRYGKDAAVECLSAWILEPALAAPGSILATLLPDPNGRTLKNLQDILIAHKKDRELRENLAWESLDSLESCKRACEFFHDVAAIAVRAKPNNPDWTRDSGDKRDSVFVASHIKKA